MSTGRSNVRVDDTPRWVFNRMADAYLARPAYPAGLVEAVSTLAPPGGSVLDVGAGTGHLALPLARARLSVCAVEPAVEMLARLRGQAERAGLPIDCLHAAAEALPLPSARFDLALLADALHFINIERAGPELARVLRPGARLAIVTSEFDGTEFMQAVARIMAESAPRRVRDTTGTIAQLAAQLGVRLGEPRQFRDATAVDPAQLETILRSISFIGPAMNAERTAAFCARIASLSDTPVWARRFTLHSGVRAR